MPKGSGLRSRSVTTCLIPWDVTKLGKTIGSDAANNKTTFLTFMTSQEAMKEAQKATESAKNAVSSFEGHEILCELADYLLERES